MGNKKSISRKFRNDTKKILDIGAGTGLELIHVFKIIPDATVTAIDIAENMLNELSKREFAYRVTTICGDFLEVAFGIDFDAVISTSALHHFKPEEKEILYKKIFDCLKPNGLFVNCDKISLSQEGQEHDMNELENNIDNYKHMDTPLTVENELKILEQVGFVDIISNRVDKDNYSLIKARKGM